MNYYKPIKDMFVLWEAFVFDTDFKDGDLYWISKIDENGDAHFTNKRTNKTKEISRDRFQLYKTTKSHLPK